MMYWGGGWGAAGGLAMTIGMIAVAVLLVAGTFLLIRPVFGRFRASTSAPEAGSIEPDNSGLGILNRRYAQGEITREEYLERRQHLVGPS